MARKFRIPTYKIKFVNRCILCGNVIKGREIICDSCRNKMKRKLR